MLSDSTLQKFTTSSTKKQINACCTSGTVRAPYYTVLPVPFVTLNLWSHFVMTQNSIQFSKSRTIKMITNTATVVRNTNDA